MRYKFILPVTLSLILASVVCCRDDKDDAKTMDGTWVPASAELAGDKWPDEFLKKMKLVTKGDKYTVTFGQVTDQGTVKLDPGKKPKSMDIIGTEGPNKGKTFLAIYELTKDELKVCYNLDGKERPTAFATKSGTQLFLVTYKREKS